MRLTNRNRIKQHGCIWKLYTHSSNKTVCFMLWHSSFSLWHRRFIWQYRELNNRKLRRNTVHALKSPVTFFTLIQYSMLQYAYCNRSLLCALGGMVVLPRGSLAAVLLGWLLLSRRLVPVSEINDILATLLSTWYLRDRDTGDALQTLYTINPVCLSIVRRAVSVCVCVWVDAGVCVCTCRRMVGCRCVRTVRVLLHVCIRFTIMLIR